MASSNKEKKDSKSAIGQNVVMLIGGVVVPYFIATKTASGNWDLLAVPTKWVPRLDLQVSSLYIVWYLAQCILYMLPVGGPLVQGLPLLNGHRLMYRLNGFFALLINIIGFLLAVLWKRKVSAIVDNSIELITIVFLVQFVISIILFLQGKPRQEYNVNTKANNGNMLQDWLLGRTLNPRVGLFDFKFVQFRLSISASVLYNFAIVVKCYEDGRCPTSTILLTVTMQLMYVTDALWNESALLSLREISREGCGELFCLLTMGIPLEYGVVAVYISTNRQSLPWYCLVGIALVYLTGYVIYRQSNDMKRRYRQNPNSEEFQDFDTISTSTGKNLLVSGWWGVCRHPNYLGDIIMNLAMCVPAGFGFWPYLNFLLILMMLVDRERADFVDCKQRYGEAWNTYCHRVKYKICPLIY